MLSQGVKRLILGAKKPAPPNPAAIFGANLVAWYSADLGVFSDAGTTPATNGQTVQQWNDQSGNGYHLTQATAGLRPSLNTSGYNSKRAIVLSAAGTTSMATSATITQFNGIGTSAFWAVAQMTTSTVASGRLLTTFTGASGVADYNYSANPGAIFLRNTSTNAIQSYQHNIASASFAVSLSTNLRLLQTQDGSTITNYFNNVSANTATQQNATFATNQEIGIGADITGPGTPGPAYWDGPLREIVVVSVTPTLAQRNQMDAWLVYNDGA